MGLAYNRGRYGEDLALRYFSENDYCLVKRNYRSRREKALSEIDLIVLTLGDAAPPRLKRLYAELQQTPLCLETLKTAGSDRENVNSVTSNESNLYYSFLEVAQSFLSLVFVEVKYWKAYPLADLGYNLTPSRQQRMLETAECFLQSYPALANLKLRFDLFIIQGSTASYSHIESAFS